MKKQPNWEIPDDYEYLEKLSDKGWAWEFLRRSPDYRAAYAPFDDLYKKHGSDWRKFQKTLYFPEKKPEESDDRWRRRAASLGLEAKKITQSRQVAQDWELQDMYHPDADYSTDSILFRKMHKFPVFYGDPLASNNKKAERINSAKLLHLRHINDFAQDVDDLLKDSALVVVFSSTYNIDEQLQKAKKVLTAHNRLFKQIISRGHRKKWVSYIRVLDALIQSPEAKNPRVLLTIVKDKAIQTADIRTRNNKAGDLKRHALGMANIGYRKLLFRD